MSHMEKVEYKVPAVGSVWETEGGSAKVEGVQVRVSYQFTDEDGDSWSTTRSLDNFLEVYEPAEDKVEAKQTWVKCGAEFYIYEVVGERALGKSSSNDPDNAWNSYADDYHVDTIRTYWELKK